MASKPTTKTARSLYERYIEGNAEAETYFEVSRVRLEISEKIYALREKVGLTQKELANRVGTSQSVISRLEDADYEGHSISMLQRIATALGHKVVIDFEPMLNE